MNNKMVDIASICYNEELLLPVWIKSWLSVPFIKNIYLIDGGSTDKSVEIAKSYDRVNVTIVPWKNDFSRQRNIAIKQAKASYVLQADIDEIPCGNNFNKMANMFDNMIGKEASNEFIIPYIKFYDWNKLWMFNDGNTPKIDDKTIEYGFKSTIIIFRKDHLVGYDKSLHEMPVIRGQSRKSLLSINRSHITNLSDLQSDFFIGHYDQAKHFQQARQNGTTVEYEMGLKRARYRMISNALYEGKTYTKEWAERVLKENNVKEIEQLGAAQLKSFLKQHIILSDYDAFGLNNPIIQKRFGNDKD